jgi:hypothetical protein
MVAASSPLVPVLCDSPTDDEAIEFDGRRSRERSRGQTAKRQDGQIASANGGLFGSGGPEGSVSTGTWIEITVD